MTFPDREKIGKNGDLYRPPNLQKTTFKECPLETIAERTRPSA